MTTNLDNTVFLVYCFSIPRRNISVTGWTIFANFKLAGGRNEDFCANFSAHIYAPDHPDRKTSVDSDTDTPSRRILVVAVPATTKSNATTHQGGKLEMALAINAISFQAAGNFDDCGFLYFNLD